jgi:hypothetical protein
MIARFQFLLPFEIAVAPDQHLTPFELTRDRLRIRVFPPYKSQVDLRALSPNWPQPASDIPRSLDPDEETTPLGTITINGAPAVLANALQLDVHGSFDRSTASDDPPTELALQVANELIAGLRLLGQAGYVRPLSAHGVWRMTDLEDDETIVAVEEGKYRRRVSTQLRTKFIALSPPLWEQVQQLEHPLPRAPWNDLLFDAFELHEQVGPALVLAAAAVETRLETALDILASTTGANPELWEWINDRGDYRKEPSVGERADKLLHALIGKSLKDEAHLWTAFQHLREARNSFVHEGVAVLGKTREPVGPDRTLELLHAANQILTWIEDQLEAQHRRAALTDQPNVEITQVMITPPPS